MKERMVTLPQLAMIAGTRIAGGAGLGLLLSDRLAPVQRRAVGWTLLAIGAITTVPLVAMVARNGRSAATAPREGATSQVHA